MRAQALAIFYAMRCYGFKLRVTIVSSSDSIGAVAFIHLLGSALNEHVHLHVCVVDGVFKRTDQVMQYFAARPLRR
jgi:hypothetical protein